MLDREIGVYYDGVHNRNCKVSDLTTKEIYDALIYPDGIIGPDDIER